MVEAGYESFIQAANRKTATVVDAIMWLCRNAANERTPSHKLLSHPARRTHAFLLGLICDIKTHCDVAVPKPQALVNNLNQRLNEVCGGSDREWLGRLPVATFLLYLF